MLLDLHHTQRLIIEAELIDSPTERYLAAHRCARQVGVCLVAAGRRDEACGRDLWALVANAAPECVEWAGFFGAVERRCASVHAAPVSPREADDLVREAQRFFVDAATLLRRRAAADQRAAS